MLEALWANRSKLVKLVKLVMLAMLVKQRDGNYEKHCHEVNRAFFEKNKTFETSMN
jgi:hypothetical protein